MANFNVHISVAATISLITSLVVYSMGLANNLQAITLTIIGTLGGILPDIDSDNSTSIRIIFTILSAIISIGALFSLLPHLKVLLSLLTAVSLFLVTRFILMSICRNFSNHRGVIHSPAFGLLISLILIMFCSFLQIQGAVFMGLFLFLGFIVHLLLDEIYTIDLQGVKLKKSFGTALTLFSFNNPVGYFLVYCLLALFIYLDYATALHVMDTITALSLHNIANHLLPTHLLNRLMPNWQ